MNLTKLFALAVLTASFVGTQFYISSLAHDAPTRPEVVNAVKKSLRAELAQAQHPLEDGKVLPWSVSNTNSGLMGTATVVGHDGNGCYDVNVQTNLVTAYKSEATYKVCS